MKIFYLDLLVFSVCYRFDSFNKVIKKRNKILNKRLGAKKAKSNREAGQKLKLWFSV